MIQGEYNELISETSGFPGSIGDSCAESSRYYLLKWPTLPLPNLKIFVTDTFFVRHPDSPWREDDFSTDQALPLYIATKNANMYYKLKKNKWRLPNGQFISPIFYAILTKKKWLINLCVFAQGILFKLPYRYDDSKKRFTKNDNSSDYLNYYFTAYYADKWARHIVKKEVILQKIKSYYQSEIDASKDKTLALEIIRLYEEEIEVLW